MEKITIKSGNNEYTYYPAINNSGNFECSTLEESIFTKGSSCSVFLAINDKNERFLIKQYNQGFTIDQEIDRISIDIKNRYNKQSSNYIMKELYSGIDNFGKVCKVFEYKNGNVLKPYKETKSIFAEENKEKLFDILLIFASFLHSLKLLHTEIDGAKYYLHNDIKPENVFSVRVNNDRIAQLIDLDSVCSGEFLIDKIESGEFSGDFNFIIPTTSKYYTREDINYLCRLRGGELRRCIRVLDTTAAAKMLCMMLFGRYDHSIPERDVDDYDSNEALQIAINSFLQKGISNNFTERFATVDEMIEEFSAILSEEQYNLPKTIQSAKLLAINNNNYIDDRRIFYRKKYEFEKEYPVYIDDLCDEIDEGILPFIQVEHGSDKNQKLSFDELLSKNRDNYVITAEGGAGKTTSLFYAFLKNIRDINDDELYIYIPLSLYRGGYSLFEFMSRESGFSFNELNKNNSNKITLLLDAFDEIYIIHNGNENEKKTFAERLFKDIQGLKNVRVIITSRMIPDDESGTMSTNFKTAKFLSLEEEQIKSFLNLDQDSYDEICTNNSLQTLLKNPFMLDIYKKVKVGTQGDIQIHSASDLLDQYFWQMYKSKQVEPGLKRVRQEYEKWMDFVAESAFFEDNSNVCWHEENDEDDVSAILRLLDEEERAFYEDEGWYSDELSVFDSKCNCNSYLNKIGNVELEIKDLSCYSFIIEFYSKNNGWHIRFSQMLFYEYFVARYLFNQLINYINIDIEFLNTSLSYQTLIFVAQMLNDLQIKFHEFDIKKHIEKVFDYVVQRKNNICNLLCIITFFMNGNLNKFNFKKYFYKNEFPKGVFYGCLELESIILPNKLCGIGASAFNGCKNLTSVIMSDSVKRIEIGAFGECASLTKVVVPKSVKIIESHAFESCTKLENIKVEEDNVKYKSINGDLYTSDGKCLIQYAIGKKDEFFTIPKGVTSIGELAFSGCKSLTSVVVPKSVKIIENHAFKSCTKLENIKVEEDNVKYKSINGDLYTSDGKCLIQYAIGKKDEFFTIPKGVTSIGKLAFSGCESLTSVVIPNSVTSIGGSAFYGCESLTEVIIPNSVKSIGESAFCGCKSLTNMMIPDSVESIGTSAFSNCYGLTSVTIGNGIKNIRRGIVGFNSKLKNITMSNSVKSIEAQVFYLHYDCPDIIFYRGSQKEFSCIKIFNGNKALDDVMIYFYSEEHPTDDGNYWHYVDGVETIW